MYQERCRAGGRTSEQRLLYIELMFDGAAFCNCF
jgi:hypothetical protein